MKNLSNNPLIVALGIISACIAIFVFVTGINKLSDVLKHSGNTPSPSEATTQISVTNPPDQAMALVTASSTTVPSTPLPLENPDTPANSILNVGQSWLESGFELTLSTKKLEYTCQGMDASPTIGFEIKFLLTSKNPQDIAIDYSMGTSVSAVSNLGQALPVGHLDLYMTYGTCNNDHPWANTFDIITTVIHSGETIELHNLAGNKWDDQKLFINTNPSDPSLTEIVVAVSRIAKITGARWRIPISH